MTKLEAIAFFMDMDECTYGSSEPIQMAIEALKQDPCEDEIILTKEEYGQLLSNEFDNGYAKGYREALEQESILDQIRAEIWDLQYGDEEKSMTDEDRADAYNNAIIQAIEIIDKYKAGSEVEI